MRTLRHYMFLLFFVTLWGCSSGNNGSTAAVIDQATGKHPDGWMALHGANAKISTSPCAECHGADFRGGIVKVSCFGSPQPSFNGFLCHAVNPAVNLGCSSCHSTPPDGVNPVSTAPNRLFPAHAAHLGLNNPTVSTTVDCNTCHFNAGFGTMNHARTSASGGINSATVMVAPTFKAKTITSAFGFSATSGTCFGVMCHGGKETPVFKTGLLDPADPTLCLSCHEQGTAFQVPQYNSFYSGTDPGLVPPILNLHQFHLDPTQTGFTVTCDNCHNVANTLDPQHFNGLDTLARGVVTDPNHGFGANPGNTIGDTPTSIGATLIDSYTPYTTIAPSGSCVASCHFDYPLPRYWKN